MIGLVISKSDCGYEDMEKAGIITIEYNQKSLDVDIVIDGFRFKNKPTCRMHSMKALEWARDVLAAQIEIERLVPGSVSSANGMSHERLMVEQAKRQK